MYIKTVVSDIIKHKALGCKTFILSSMNGKALPSFRAGQYISIKLLIDGSYVSRPYSLCSSPKDALEGKYAITVQSNPGGFAADWMLHNFHKGSEVVISSPAGSFYYREKRDEKNITALAGGSGLTPFLSMARAIRDGIEDFNLTILFGNRCADDILFKNELESICKSCKKVKVVHVLSDEKVKGCEYGFITADLVKKYSAQNFSILVCGPGSMYDFLHTELKKLKMPKRLIRFEMPAVKRNVPEKGEFILKVVQSSETYQIKAAADEPILVSIERAGIRVPSRCRSGRCSWCHSRVISGSFFVPHENDGRSKAEIEAKRIHPCATFPLSDMIIEVQSEHRVKK